ncbi:putative beta-1,3-galactosyltransferase 2-like [Hibiscus syriacus]|uniref:Beta-1,3-galactosyltransferase 2-like n=1 Tax=Hibiscus syriacus TaxID=106335 RepID=A0A6A2WFB2_HIBSY|nr:uncharacterized protein LOC120193344 [Hibiscus syriacus]KAE8657392.1 putative beta-1,3-galactosyltransferase 2-like [Hibiscus syriacus]
MNRRSRSLARHSLPRSEPFLRYLKPGALARLRDSRISARSHRTSSLFQISPSLPSSNDGQLFLSAAMDGFPCFVPTARVFGPRCLQRRKLIAAKGMLFQSSALSAMDLPDPVVDLLASE